MTRSVLRPTSFALLCIMGNETSVEGAESAAAEGSEWCCPATSEHYDARMSMGRNAFASSGSVIIKGLLNMHYAQDTMHKRAWRAALMHDFAFAVDVRPTRLQIVGVSECPSKDMRVTVVIEIKQVHSSDIRKRRLQVPADALAAALIEQSTDPGSRLRSGTISSHLYALSLCSRRRWKRRNTMALCSMRTVFY